MRRFAFLVFVAAACAELRGAPPAVVVAAAPGPALLIRGASVMTAAGPTLTRADLLVRGGRIEAVGAELAAPDGAEVIDARGKWVTPGIIDPHSHIGVYPVPDAVSTRDGNEMSGPFKAEVRVEDGLWPQDPAIERALAGGVTTVHVLPGSANLIGGQGVTLRLGASARENALRFPNSPATLKLACGENPKRIYGAKGQAPQTRMGEVAMLRAKLESASKYKANPEKPRDFAAEALSKVISGEILVQNHCYRADEMRVRLALFREYGVTPRAFHHAVEAYKIRDELAAAGVAAVIWTDWWGIKLELLDAIPENAALLDEAGVRVALHSDSPDDVQRLNQEASKALAAGLRAGVPVDRERALRWITANPAWVIGIDARTGTLEPGKDADLVIWSADPFSVYARAERVYVAGRLAFERGVAREPLSDFELGLRGTEAP